LFAEQQVRPLLRSVCRAASEPAALRNKVRRTGRSDGLTCRSANKVYWNKFKGTNEYPIKGKYLNQIHNKYVKKGVYREIHKEILKKYIKIDLLTDSYGTPLNANLSFAKRPDSDTLIDCINTLPVNLNTLRNSKINRHKQTLLADPGYDTKKILFF